MESLIFLIRVTVLSVKYLNSTLLSDFFGHRRKYQILTKIFAKNRNFMKKNLISHKNSGHVFWTNIDLSYHFRILRMSTFQEMIQFFNNTHVRNAIHENVCVIFYGTDLSRYPFNTADNKYVHTRYYYYILTIHIGISLKCIYSTRPMYIYPFSAFSVLEGLLEEFYLGKSRHIC